MLQRPISVSLALLLLALAGGCSHTRIEHYYTVEASPTTVSRDGLNVALVYFKQSQRHFYATVRVTNTGDQPIAVRRIGDGGAPLTLTVLGTTYLAASPDTAYWTPWGGVIEQERRNAGTLELAPGSSGDMTLRFEFPTTIGSYTYDWTLSLAGLKRNGEDIPPILLAAPAER